MTAVENAAFDAAFMTPRIASQSQSVGDCNLF